MNFGKKRMISIIGITVLISLYIFSQDFEWIPKFPIDPPSARLQMSMVYDCDKNETIMFGGILRTSDPSMKKWPTTKEMWKWDGTTWTQLTPDILPDPRRSAGMVYDSDTKKIILFGGFNSPTLDPTPYEKIVYNDTWEWDGENWIEVIPNGLAPPFSPDKKWGHCMVYDKIRKKTVLFGGYNAYQSPYLFDETWEYDSNTHTWEEIQLLTHPERRRYASIVFDENRGKIVLFGGVQTSKVSAFNDSWVFDGEWIELQTENPPEPRHESRMVYNYLSGNVFIFGGYGGIVSESPLGDFWELDGFTWIQKFSADFPIERYAHGMVSDANRQEIVLYGGTTGFDALDDTWIYGWPPIEAVAGPDISILSEEKVTTILEGTAISSSLDNVSYRWVEGETVLSSWQGVGENGEAWLDLSAVQFYPLVGVHTLTLEVERNGAVSEDSMNLTLINSSPHAAAGGGGVYEINTDVTLCGNVSDFDGDMLNYQWTEGTQVLFSGSIQSTLGGAPVELPQSVISNLNLGIHHILLSVNDGINDLAISEIIIEIVDTNIPTLAPIADKTILWPPDHKMVDITIATNANDNSGALVTLSVSVISNEPQDGLGDGDMSPDWTTPEIDQTAGIITLQLRSERPGIGDGRLYIIDITATDASGNSSDAQVEIIVPHGQKKK
jgi:hypothetical protein